MSARGLALLLLVACGGPGDKAGDSASPDASSNTGILSRDQGWMRGDLHMHTTYSDGWEDPATVIAIGEYLEDPVFLAFHPEYQGNGLDFLAITDHRGVDAWEDPGFRSDRLTLIHGEEFGSAGHAGALGINALVPHDPDGDGVTQSDIDAAVSTTHAMGGVFSPNHPFLPDIPFPWHIHEHDAIEVWNSGWALMSPDNTPENLASWEASHGTASLMYRKALELEGQGASAQALAWYEAQLARGVHVALVGGSDRHAVLMPGFPTTWVRAESSTETGIIEGIRQRRTFVSRTPASAQIEVRVQAGSGAYEMGAEVPIPTSGEVIPVRVRVGRAEGARVRVVQGHAVESDEDLADMELSGVVAEETVTGTDYTLETSLSVSPGDWFYAIVLEPLLAPGISEAQADRVEAFAVAAVELGDEDFIRLAAIIGELADPEVLGDASACDPEDWVEDRMQCIPADPSGIATFFVPDMFDRALNTTRQDGAPDGWCMGALASAVRFVEE
jgi:hypothetical protein